MWLWIIVGLLVLLVIVAVALFNGFVTKRNRVDRANADLDAAYQKRYDTIPNLVDTVKSYKNFEKGTLEAVTKARTAAMNAGAGEAKEAAENQLSGALKSLFAVAESYPDLKASENYLQLQGELVDLEDKILAARRFFNASVLDYNTSIQTFPGNVMAKPFGFDQKSSFEVKDASVREAQKVNFEDDQTK
jgi:LemA protein